MMALSLKHHTLINHCLAVLTIATAIAVANIESIKPMSFALFLFAVALVAWSFGNGPAVTAVFLSCLALAYFFLPPEYSLRIDDPTDALRLGIFAVISLILIATKKLGRFCGRQRQPLSKRVSPARRQRLAEPREIEQLFAVLVTSLSDLGVVRMKANGVMAAWYSDSLPLTGYSAAELLGRHLGCLSQDSGIIQGVQHSLEAAVRQGRFEEQRWLVRKDGSRFLARLVVTPLWGQSENLGVQLPLDGFVLVMQDLTGRPKP